MQSVELYVHNYTDIQKKYKQSLSHFADRVQFTQIKMNRNVVMKYSNIYYA